MGTIRLIGVWVLLGSAASALAHDVISTKLTFTQEISRILQRRCLGCHRDGGTAPMAFTSYAQVRPWAKAIKEEVLERRMPPWGAVDGFGEFSGDISLTADEIHVLADWVEGGAPEGDAQYLPAGFANPRPLAAPAPPHGSSLVLSSDFTLTRPLHLLAIHSDTPVRATAELPGGRTIPLIWIRQVRPQHPPAYLWRQPTSLPAAARIRLSGAAAVRVWIKRY